MTPASIRCASDMRAHLLAQGEPVHHVTHNPAIAFPTVAMRISGSPPRLPTAIKFAYIVRLLSDNEVVSGLMILLHFFEAKAIIGMR